MIKIEEIDTMDGLAGVYLRPKVGEFPKGKNDPLYDVVTKLATYVRQLARHARLTVCAGCAEAFVVRENVKHLCVGCNDNRVTMESASVNTPAPTDPADLAPPNL